MTDGPMPRCETCQHVRLDHAPTRLALDPRQRHEADELSSRRAGKRDIVIAWLREGAADTTTERSPRG